MDALQSLIILNSIEGIGPVKIRQLIAAFGSPEAVLTADKSEVLNLPGFGAKLTENLAAWRDAPWEQDFELITRYQTTVIPYTDPRYPKKLLEVTDHPVVLYCKGNIDALQSRHLAIIGTRNASVYGREMAQKFGRELASNQFSIVSGLARGIDTCAHQGALEAQGTTIAVIGSGLAKLYPPENAALADAITQNGAVISEFPMRTPPDRKTFPQRNRIVSGMSVGALVIESPIKSGSMITMEKAEAQGRPLFALPGRVDNTNFDGNHLLVKQGRAKLVTAPKDIADHFDSLFTSTGAARPKAPPLDPAESQLFDLLPGEELPIDDIVYLSKLPIPKLNVLLMSLVLKKRVKEFPGRVYKKIG